MPGTENDHNNSTSEAIELVRSAERAASVGSKQSKLNLNLMQRVTTALNISSNIVVYTIIESVPSTAIRPPQNKAIERNQFNKRNEGEQASLLQHGTRRQYKQHDFNAKLSL